MLIVLEVSVCARGCSCRQLALGMAIQFDRREEPFFFAFVFRRAPHARKIRTVLGSTGQAATCRFKLATGGVSCFDQAGL